MKWLDSLLGRASNSPIAAKSNLSIDRLVRSLDLLRATAAGEQVTPQTALNSPTIFAIVHAFAKVLGMLPIDVIQGTGTSRKNLPNHELAWLLNRRPNQWQTRYDYWFCVAAQMVLHGEFLAVKNQANNGKIVNLVPIPPGACCMKQLPGSFEMSYTVSAADGTSQEYSQKRIHHVRMGTVDGVNAIKPIDRIRESIAMEIAAEKFGAQLFGGGAIPNLVIEHPSHFLTEETAKAFKKSWADAFRKKRGTAVLEDGMKITPVQLTNEESQFLETRKHQRTVIAGAFGIPPHRIGDLERATFGNIEHQGLEFVSFALMPYLVAIEAAAHRDLIPESQKADTAIKFNVDALLRGDSKSRAETLQIERQMGIINANEWRALTDRQPRADPEGDTYMTPLNMSAGKEKAPAAAAAEPVGGEPAKEPPP